MDPSTQSTLETASDSEGSLATIVGFEGSLANDWSSGPASADAYSARGEGGGLVDLGFGSDVWKTPFGDYVNQLRNEGLDVVFLFDSTSSMSGFIREAKESIHAMIRVFQTLVPQFRLSIATYRDYGDDFVVLAEDLTLERYRLLAFLHTIDAHGGGDIEEAVLAGLEKTTRELAWNGASHRVIVLIGDAPPHANEVRETIAVARRFREQGGQIHTLVTFAADAATNDSERKTVRTFREIARAGGGEATSLADAYRVAPELLVLSFGERFRPQIESACQAAMSRSAWRDRLIRRSAEAGDTASIVRKLKSSPVYPGVVDALLESNDPSVVPLVLETLQDERVSMECRWAGLYVLLRLLEVRPPRLPDDPLGLVRDIEAHYRQRVTGGAASQKEGGR